MKSPPNWSRSQLKCRLILAGSCQTIHNHNNKPMIRTHTNSNTKHSSRHIYMRTCYQTHSKQRKEMRKQNNKHTERIVVQLALYGARIDCKFNELKLSTRSTQSTHSEISKWASGLSVAHYICSHFLTDDNYSSSCLQIHKIFRLFLNSRSI